MAACVLQPSSGMGAQPLLPFLIGRLPGGGRIPVPNRRVMEGSIRQASLTQTHYKLWLPVTKSLKYVHKNGITTEDCIQDGEYV